MEIQISLLSQIEDELWSFAKKNESMSLWVSLQPIIESILSYFLSELNLNFKPSGAI